MEITATSTTYPCALPVANHRTAPMGTSGQGTRVSAAMRSRTIAPVTKAIDLLPNSAVVFDGPAGIRSWSPPV